MVSPGWKLVLGEAIIPRRCAKEKYILFVNSPADAFEIDLRPPSRQFHGREFFIRGPSISEHRQRSALELVIAALRHPQDPDWMKNPPFPQLLMLLPQLRSTSGHFCI